LRPAHFHSGKHLCGDRRKADGLLVHGELRPAVLFLESRGDERLD
jgi:hypothetical protein